MLIEGLLGTLFSIFFGRIINCLYVWCGGLVGDVDTRVIRGEVGGGEGAGAVELGLGQVVEELGLHDEIGHAT